MKKISDLDRQFLADGEAWEALRRSPEVIAAVKAAAAGIAPAFVDHVSKSVERVRTTIIAKYDEVFRRW